MRSRCADSTTAIGGLALAPCVSHFPGRVIVPAVLAFNIIGDGLRDALDPRAGGGGDMAFEPSDRIGAGERGRDKNGTRDTAEGTPAVLRRSRL